MSIHYGLCSFCDASCGLEIEVEGKEIRSIRGDPEDIFSRGHVCPKGIAQQDLYSDPDRLRLPLRREGSSWREVSWDEALAFTAERAAAVQKRHGRDALALYFGNPISHHYGALLHLVPFARGLRTRNVYSAGSVDSFSRMLVSHLLYGSPAILPVPDLKRTHYLLILGANPAVSNGSIMTAPDCRNRLKELSRRGAKLVVIDPRRTETASIATEHHFIVPGTDALLLLAMLHEIFAHGAAGRTLSLPCDNLERVQEIVWDFPPARVARRTGIHPETIQRLAAEFAASPAAVCYGRMGTAAQRFGTLATWLIDVLNLVTGNLDRRGGAMFATPAVDLVGLAARLGVSGSFRKYRSRVRGLPEFNGELPVAALADEMDTPGPGQIRGLITIAGNPVLSIPNGARLDRLLPGLDFMASIDFYLNETTRHAQVILPPVSPLESDHYPLLEYALAVHNVAHYAPAVVPKPEGTLEDWEILMRLAQGLGHTHGGLWRLTGSLHGFLGKWLTPRRVLGLLLRKGPHRLRLRDLEEAPHGLDLGPLEPRLRAILATKNRRIDLAPPPLAGDVARLEEWLSAPAHHTREFLLVGMRTLTSMNSWLHNCPRLMAGRSRCALLMHPSDASALAFQGGETVRVSSPTGDITVPLEVSDSVMPGVVCLPFGWGHSRPGVRLSVASAHAGASYNDLLSDLCYDPVSGTSVLNGVAVRVEAARM